MAKWKDTIFKDDICIILDTRIMALTIFKDDIV